MRGPRIAKFCNESYWDMMGYDGICVHMWRFRGYNPQIKRIELGTLRCLSKFKIAMGRPIKPNELLYIYHNIYILYAGVVDDGKRDADT